MPQSMRAGERCSLPGWRWRSAASPVRRQPPRPTRCPIRIARSRTGPAAARPELGLDQRGRHRSRRHQRLGRRALRRVRGRRRASKPGTPFACDGSTLDPILKFDASGKLVKSFGAGLILFPHGLHVDRDGNVWVTDGLGRGQQGPPGVQVQPRRQGADDARQAGQARQRPRRIQRAVGGGDRAERRHLRRRRPWRQHQRAHREVRQGRQVHQDLGQERLGPGRTRHPACARDGFARTAVRRRPQNNRIQIFDQDGNFIDQWHQFSRPSGIFIDKNDIIYVADSDSESVAKNHDGWKRGIRIGSVQRRHGDGVHSRPGREERPAPARPKAWRRTRRATSTAPRSARSG